ncbi:MAG: drug/metabolite exporter YedA [Gemmatimonadetes bacterium]|nr:drug/metabolite exporter YedA [Gemmatimonadota bacterium]NNF14751.1 drug/metabolite exporter YedA [Gemmatimonadota bacterium]
MSARPGSSDPPTLMVLGAFAAVYVIWGSTYLAIRFAIETLPPFAMASVRFLIAGGLLYALVRPRAPSPTKAQWRSAAVIGVLLLGCGNGGVVWAQQWVPSGLAALLVASVPIWMVVIDWLFGGGQRPSPSLLAGLGLGLIGVGLLVSSEQIGAGSRESLLGGLALLFASFAWASGSIYSRRAELPASPFLTTAMQMLAGSAALALMSVVSGEATGWSAGTISAKSVLALLYLIVFGALVGYSAYIWLLRVSTPARASTYAYVNPVVAVLLGGLFADEQLDARAAVAMVVILVSVIVVTVTGGARRVTEDPRAVGAD